MAERRGNFQIAPMPADEGDPGLDRQLLVETKLTPPRVRPGTVEQARVMSALDAGVDAPLTLVAAPPGFGKTTAVREWCARRGAAVAWVTVDGRDNDPDVLWTYVATAVDRVRPGLGREALQRLRTTGTSTEGRIDALMSGLAAYAAEVAIVLDDVHALTDRDCLASIDYALNRLPPRAHVIAITRTDPGLRLSRLRANGDLVEIRADDLAFTAQETRELVASRGELGSLDADELEVLRGRTDGWPAVLVLATLWLRAVDDPHRALHEFGVGHQYVASYLSEEVFDSLTPDARAFLLHVSVLGRFTAELCDAVLGRTDSAALLAQLDASTLLVNPLERGGWFEVHSLIAEFAGLRLASEDPGAASRIRRRAAEWCRAHGMAVEAVEHAASAGDHGLVADILSEQQLAVFRRGGARTLLRWIGMLPVEVVVDHPVLAVAAATSAFVVGGRTLDVRRYLALADRAGRERPDALGAYGLAEAAVVRAATIEGGVGEAVRAGRRAVELGMAGGDDALVAALGAHARALYLAGDDDAALAAATRAVEHPDIQRRPPGHAFARTTLALVTAGRGELDRAREHAETARLIVGRVGNSRTWLGANTAVALGRVLMAEDALPEAERELAYGEGVFDDEVPTVHHAWVVVLLAQVRCRRGRLNSAESGLELARREIASLPDVGRVTAMVVELERELRELRRRADGGELLTTPSTAELAVLRLLPTDLSAREIAAELFVSSNTVRSHMRKIYRKLGVQSRADAVARASALGLIDPQSGA
ncbi:MAG TPA: LuxR C-terminal-related transcriptional regulator [Gaiellales bacterium]|jgi:LuxR family maltose regulon positive regulatory protein|nr:LuxR C-terminal-related transcriptional regulator [Gaiellales bacterium]